MRDLYLVAAVSFTVGCTETPLDHELEGPTPDPAIECVSPALGVLHGSAQVRHGGSSGADELAAEVMWTPAGTTGCVDRYRPSGTVTYRNASGQGEGDAAIEPGDGELLVDRSTRPPTYTMRGDSRFGVWTEHRGSFDGDVLAGGLIADADASRAMRWSFVREDATFAPPTGCSQPAIDRWTTVSEQEHTRATVTWTRASTSGCVDTFRPSGTVESAGRSTPYCASLTAHPASAPIAAADGVLTIDRSTNPATYRIEGRTVWDAQVVCTTHDGTVEMLGNLGGGRWASFQAAFDGAQFAGAFDARDAGPASWRFTRE